jgi:hypothetical protein
MLFFCFRYSHHAPSATLPRALIHIHINCIRCHDSDHLFNVALFPRLEFLQLRRGPIHPNVQDYGDEHMKLLGHSLKTFCWDFTRDDCYYFRNQRDFGEAEACLVRKLAGAAIEYKSALETITIKYSLDEYRLSMQTQGFPWEYMNDTRDQFSGLGITLVYAEPQMSKDEWLQHCTKTTGPNQNIHKTAKKMVEYQVSTLSAEEKEEEEVQLESFYHDLLKPLYQGEDIRKYTSPSNISY